MSYKLLADYEEALKEKKFTHRCGDCGERFITQKGKSHTKCPKCGSINIGSIQ